MAKQLNVDLRFNADTSQAKKAIQDLQNTLNNLSSLGTAASTNGFNQQIASATVEANKLKVALTDAFNTKTGAIDLSKLQANLRQAGSSIEQVSNSLINMGPVGQRAFQQFAATIAQAQVPTMRLNGLLGEMWTTLKNVARFQISSSIIHGLIGGVQSAFSYAQNLNQSLNNIRIVTGDNVEKMAQFAREANNAAKALSSTTLDYTNASLIYYQQGLDDQAVKARTDVTVKLANVTRQSAEEVSSQMTAIWNNFDDGAHSMEYFADVITALGATTASSSAEIAQGLQKFAPIAGTIGLSYEKATAALAAIIATTRQSADTVGTGLRTIFSRFESLKLGETLEDGVDLNKYTNAMKTIGVNVLDANGKLREMDGILDDIAENWQKLDNTQKTAFATTVGGVRQYTNLMALFENWDKVQQNLATATGAEGTLQGQADIYAESWEAARDRVKTALQGLYDSLINDDFFIDLLNGIEKLITGVDRFVQSIGGAKGVILGVAAAILSFANAGVSSAISNMTYNIMSLTGAGQKRADEMRNSVINKALAITPNGSEVQKAESQVMQNQVRLQQVLNTYGKEYNAIQKQIAQSLVQQQQSYDQQVVASHEALRDVQLRIRVAEQQRDNAVSDRERERIQQHITDLTLEEAEIKERLKVHIDDANKSLQSTETSLKNLATSTMSGADIFAAMASGATSATFAVTTIINAVKTLGDESVSTGQKIQTLLLNIPMGLTMAANAWKNGFGKIWGGLKSNAITNNATALEPLLKNKYTINTGTKNANIYQSLLAGNKNNPSYPQAIADLKQLKSLSEERIAQLIDEAKAEALATAKASGKTVADKAETEAILAKKIAQEGANKAAAVSLLKYAAIAAAIAAVVAVIYLAVKAYNADANAAKKAAENAKALREQSDATAQKAKELKNIFSNYDTAVDALKRCTKGTKEWYDALENVNNIVLEILEKYPELAGQLDINRSNGYAEIKNADDIIKQAEKNAQNIQVAALIGAINASQAQLKSDQTNTYRQFKQSEQQGDRGGANLNATKNNQIRNEIIENAIEYSGLSLEDFGNKVRRAGLDISDFEIKRFQSAINELGDSTQALANQINNTTAIIMEQQLGNNYDLATKGLTGTIYNNAKNIIEQDILSQGKLLNRWAGANNDLVKSIWERYKAATGTNYALTSNAVQGGRNNRTFQYYDSTGKASNISLENVATTIAAHEALQKLTGSANTASVLLDSLPTNVKDSVTNYFANGNLDEIAVGEFQKITEHLFEDGVTEEQKQKIVEEFFGGTESFDKIIQAQVGSDVQKGSEAWKAAANRLVDDWVNAATKYNLAVKNLGDNLTPTVKTVFDNFKNNNEQFGGLKISYQDQIAQMLQTTYAYEGEEGLNTAIKKLNEFNSDELIEFLDILNDMDWGTEDISDFNDKLLESNNKLSSLIGPFDAFLSSLEKTKQELINIKQATESYSTIESTKDKLLSGQGITSDEYDKAIAAGFDNLDNYVTMDKAGNYWLTADATEFSAAADIAANQMYNAIVSGGTEAAQLIKEAMGGENSDSSAIIPNNDNISSNAIAKHTGQTYTGGPSGGYTSYDFLSTNTEQLELQLAVLEKIGNNNYTEWASKYRDNLLTEEDGAAIAAAFSMAVGGATTYEQALEFLNEQQEKTTLAAAMSAQSTEELGMVYLNGETNLEGYHKGLIKLGNSYSGCNDEVREFNEVLEDNLEDSNKAREASRKLWDVIRKAEWKKVAQEAKSYIDVLENAESTPTDLQEAYDGLAETFNKTFNTKITGKWVEDNKDKFHEWATASKEEANDVAENILDLAKLDFLSDNFESDFANKFNIDPESFSGVFDGFETKYEWLRSYLSANPLNVDAEGHANLGPLMSAIGEMGGSAQTVAAMLTAIGQTSLDLQIDSGELQHFDLTTEEGINAFLEALGDWNARFEPGGDVPVIKAIGSSATDADAYMKPAGGGGGGSKAKSHTRKQRDNNDRYKPILAKQEDKKRQIDAAKDRADRLAGKARIDNLREENKLLGDNIELQKEYINEITNYLGQDKDNMVNALAGFGLTIDFDPNGVINNYDAIMDKLYAIYNQKADQAMDEDAWKKFEDSWQNAIDAVNQYIETRDLEEEQQENLNDMLNEQLDQLLEIVNTELELNIQVNDQDLNLLDHLLNKVNDDAYKAAEAIALMGDKAAKELERANYYQNAINSTLATYGLGSVDQLLNMSPEELQGLGITQDTIDNLIDWNNELLDITETLDDLQKEIREKVIDTFDELNKKVQDSYDFFSHYNTLLESYRNIADLNTAAIGKESRELIRMLDNSMLRNSQNALRSSKQIYDKLVEDRQIAQQKLQEAEEQGLIGEADAYRDLIEDIDGQIRDAQEQWLADWEDGLEKAKDILERSVEDAVKNYEELLAPLYGSLDALNDVYEMRKEIDADYVQDYEKLYQLNKLNRDLEKTLNDVQGIQNRKQLLALQEKINKLQKDGTKMSEYDLEVLEKEFEVQQARIALEEAANAKSTVRLQRDNEGNWGYVYAADADTIEEAQQNYEDKLYEYQKLNDEYIREMSDKLMELSSTAKEKIAEVWSDSTLSPEEKQAKTDEIVAWFNAQRDFISSQMQNALDNQQNLTQRFYDTYQNTYAEVMDTYEETMLAEATKIDNLNEWLSTLSTGFNNLLDEVMVASDVYLEHIAETNEAAGSSIEDLADDITDAAATIDEASLQNIENIEELAQAVQDGLVSALDSAIEQEARLADKIAQTTQQIEEQCQAWNNVYRMLNQVGDAAAAAYYPLDTLARSTEQYGISQPSYNPDDWIANEQIGAIFDEVYNQDYWQQQHQYADELQDAIDEWMTLLSMQALTAMGGFGTLTSPYYHETEDGTLQQEVHIEANFPGVTDRGQIEEAFENLVNKAAQFANRKRQG